MIRTNTNAPLASSCGRLFDAVAGALGADTQTYEGEAAARLEAMAADIAADPYPFATREDPTGLPRLDPQPMWHALLADLAAGIAPALISARFHAGLAAAIAHLALALRQQHAPGAAIALSGGSFQNRRLLQTALQHLEAGGARVLLHAKVPANDGGLALGQAAIAIAQTR